MNVLEPGHIYALSVLDGKPGEIEILCHAKRIGAKYPGNKEPSHPGTTLQEVWRANLDRLRYLDKQEPSPYNLTAIYHIEQAIAALEDRAADRHGRTHNTVEESCYGLQCRKCLHVGCGGECR